MRSTAPLAVGVAAALTLALPTVASAETCHDTPIGLSANHVNEVPDTPVTVTCDIGVYLDQDATVDGLELDASTDDMPDQRFGVYVAAAEVDLSDVVVTSPEDYARQFVGITYRDGATGQVTDTSVRGAHRAGIVIRGAGTDVAVRDAELVGIGPKDSGWAQNGLQVDDGAVASIIGSLVEGHYWVPNSYVSSGLLAYTGGTLTAHHNTIRDNDANVVLYTGGNKVAHNDVVVDLETTTVNDEDVEVATLQYGILVAGNGNHVAQNTVAAAAGDTGIYVYAGSTDTKLIRNDVSGWETAVSDNGDDTKRPNPVAG